MGLVLQWQETIPLQGPFQGYRLISPGIMSLKGLEVHIAPALTLDVATSKPRMVTFLVITTLCMIVNVPMTLSLTTASH